jgi:hypothetical protein
VRQSRAGDFLRRCGQVIYGAWQGIHMEFIVAAGRIHGAILRDNIVAGTVLDRTSRARGGLGSLGTVGFRRRKMWFGVVPSMIGQA